MATTTKPSPEITRAAERYLEQYGDPLVMNTLSEGHHSGAGRGLPCARRRFSVRSQMALANMHPLIIRINDVGRAEAIDYRNFQYRPAGGGEQVLPHPLGGALLQPESLHHRA